MQYKADKIQSWMLAIFKDSVPHPFTVVKAAMFSLSRKKPSYLLFLLTVGGELGSDITICTMGKIREKVQIFVTKDIVYFFVCKQLL